MNVVKCKNGCQRHEIGKGIFVQFRILELIVILFMLLAALQYCLSSAPSSPCYVLKCQGLTVMLDCALDLSPLLNFTPLPMVHRYVAWIASALLCDGIMHI